MRIERLEGRRSVARFVRAGVRLHDPALHAGWVPTLPLAEGELLSGRHPFWAAADRALFLARRDGRVVGRVAAVENRAHNERHGDRTGFFGFFETVNDGGVSSALLDAAREWLGRRGLASMRGPVSPSLNYQAGCLVEGFEGRNTFMTPWSPPWHGPRLEEAGLEGVRDLVACPFTDHRDLPGRVVRAAETVRRRGSLEVRELDRSAYEEHAALMRSLYNEAWSATWGFVPLSEAEFHDFADAFRHLVRERLAFFVESRGETVGFALVVPDYNAVLAGPAWRRWAPVAIPRMLLARRRLRTARVMLLGLRASHRGSRALPFLIHEIRRRCLAEGMVSAEASWLLEGGLMHRAMESLGAPVTRRWRIYEGSTGGRA